MDLWTAPLAGGPLDALVDVPGSKSLTNRYLVLAALADAPGRLRGALRSRDTLLMAAALTRSGRADRRGRRRLGGHARAAVHGLDEHPLRTRRDRHALPAGGRRDRRRAGPVRRRRLRAGPARWVRSSTALRTLGVRVEEHGEPGHLPFTVHGRGSVRGGQVDVDASASSQFVSGLLLAAARFEQGLTLRHTGRTLPEPAAHRDDGRAAARGGRRGRRLPARRSGRSRPVRSPAATSASSPTCPTPAPFLCAALVAGGTVRVPGWPTSTTQPGGLLPGILERMGATTRAGR